ncbi:hypothetical protein OHB12_06875 [Nocardia sp. NBC_01730]|uniref:hypothetical protein n=1 Tax=Nocardia sp. NBC_01730 TaxID=2975998 RepID=UPI002E123514|nr:hypothetical protein OHB12_06875 [Nocardia sp. NBC_01730]
MRWFRTGQRALIAAIADEFNPRGFRVPNRQLPNWVVRAVAVFDRGVRLTLPAERRPEGAIPRVLRRLIPVVAAVALSGIAVAAGTLAQC